MDDLYVSLYEHVASGVARVRNGVVRYANPASSKYALRVVGERFAHPLLDEMTRAACRGLTPLPLRFDVAAPHGSTRHGDDAERHESGEGRETRDEGPNFLATPFEAVSVVVTPAPWYDNELLVLFSPSQRRRLTESPLVRFIEQISSETSRPLEHLIHDLDASAKASARANGLDAAIATRKASVNAQALHHKMAKVRDIAALLRASGRQAHERMLLRSLVAQAIEDTAALACARGITVHVSAADSAWPAVYGSQLWLSKAVSEYMEHVIQSSTPGGDITISLQVTGTRASIRARAPATAFISIGLALSQHIVEQHGGSVQIEDEFDAIDIVLELPAGAPAIEDTRLAVEQAERFERSVSELRSRPTPGSGERDSLHR